MRPSRLLAVGIACVGAIHAAWAGELSLSTAGAPFAPLDVSKSKSAEAHSTLSKSRRQELAAEFRGLVALGLKTAPYTQWNGRSMADCYEGAQRAASPIDRWAHKCEIMTGAGMGYYFFYADSVRGGTTLQRVDVVMDVSDPALLQDLQPDLQSLFGTGLPKGKIRGARYWNTGEHMAELFLDESQIRISGAPKVRFVWNRRPLTKVSQAR